MGESWNEVGQAVPAIEAVFEFGEIALCVFWPEGVIAAAQGRLQVAEHGIDPVELRLLHRGAAAPADHDPMPASGTGDAVEALQPVGNHLAAGRQVLAGPVGNVRLPETLDHVQLDALGVAFFAGLHRGYERGLAVGPAAPLAPAPLAAQIGIVQLHPAAKTPASGTLGHHLHQLVLDAPGGIVGNPQLAVQLHRRDPLLGLGQQVDRLEPEGQRQLAGLEDGPGDDRGLPAAAVALAQLAGVQETAPVVAAVRAHEAVRPAQPEQCVMALVLVSVMFEKFVETEAFLELDRISLHGYTPF